MSYYAEDATVEVVVRLAHRTGRQTFRKRDLYEMAKRHKAEWSEYNARRENVAVEIAPSGAQAEIRSKLVESWAQNGKRFTMASEEQHLLELREGGLLIVRSNVMHGRRAEGAALSVLPETAAYSAARNGREARSSRCPDPGCRRMLLAYTSRLPRTG